MCHFNPRAPYGARPNNNERDSKNQGISIHAPHTGRDAGHPVHSRNNNISIHAPHTGRDGLLSPIRTALCNFNPRAPYGARRFVTFSTRATSKISIHAPHTGRDSGIASLQFVVDHFNPRAPYGARRDRLRQVLRGRRISIHAPHTGRDFGLWPTRSSDPPFQSTRPIRGATQNRMIRRRYPKDFNPRAPYGARHFITGGFTHERTENFNPRAPYGARRFHKQDQHGGTTRFQSTRPIRGATTFRRKTAIITSYFNPRAPYGARRRQRRGGAEQVNFNPRAPYGARRRTRRAGSRRGLISIHAPHTGRDAVERERCGGQAISIHAPHTGRDLFSARRKRRSSRFQSTRPIRGATACRLAVGFQRRYFNPRAPYGARRARRRVAVQPLQFQSTRPIRGATGGRLASDPRDHISIHAPHTGRDS